jgi:flagellar L-ring protein precursor FlgH
MWTHNVTARFFALLSFVFWGVSGGNACAGVIDPDSYHALASDRRAFRTGDPLVVQVAESTNAESSAGTDSHNDSGFRARFFDSVSTHQAGLGFDGRDEGLGQTARKGRAFTQISVRVAEVLPQGLLRIAGIHDLVINGEHQRISVSGLVRSVDIGRDNSVLSNRIAEARISIVGDGDVDRARRPRLLTRVRQWLGL